MQPEDTSFDSLDPTMSVLNWVIALEIIYGSERKHIKGDRAELIAAEYLNSLEENQLLVTYQQN